MSPFPAPGSLAAHDALLAAYVAWRGAEGAFDADPTLTRAKSAGDAWIEVVRHAGNCGCAMTEPHILTWARRRIASYGRLLAVAGDELDRVLA